MFPVSLPDCKGDLVLALDQADVHVDMANILCERSSRPSDYNNARLDRDSHTVWDLQFFGLQYVTHLPRFVLVHTWTSTCGRTIHRIETRKAP